MLTGFLITFRETLEAALVVGIVLAYLVQIKQLDYRKFIWWGVVFGILASVVGAVIFTALSEGFTGQTEEIFDGLLMFIAAGLLTTLILWMMKQGKYIRQRLEERVAKEITKEHAFGLLALVFFAVLREGVEMVIFLGAASRLATMNIFGPLLGVVIALLTTWIIFLGMIKLSLRVFFKITSIILILFAAGLVAHGIHEFQEAGVLPVIVEHLWDINWLIDEKSTLGSILKAFFGYNGNPSMLEVLGWLTYLGLSFWAYRVIERRSTNQNLKNKTIGK